MPCRENTCCVVDDLVARGFNRNFTSLGECEVISITTTSLANGAPNVAYSATLASTGGTAPLTWTLALGSLPAGLTLSSAGVISGTPLESGTFTFTVLVEDSEDEICSQQFTLTINATITEAVLATVSNITWLVYAPNADRIFAGGPQDTINYVTPAKAGDFTSAIGFEPAYNPLDGKIYGGDGTPLRRLVFLNPLTLVDDGFIDLSGSLVAGGTLKQTIYCAVSDGNKYLVAVYYAGGANSRVVFVNAATQAFVTALTMPTQDPYSLLAIGDTLYVGVANITGRLHKINLLTLALTGTITLTGVGSGSMHTPALCSTNGMVYWPFQDGGTAHKVIVFDPTSETVITNIAFPRFPSMVVDWPPDGKVAVSIWDEFGFRIINPLTNTIQSSHFTDRILGSLIMAPNGRLFGGAPTTTMPYLTSSTPYP